MQEWGDSDCTGQTGGAGKLLMWQALEQQHDVGIMLCDRMGWWCHCLL